jgi:hypothetical protein
MLGNMSAPKASDLLFCKDHERVSSESFVVLPSDEVTCSKKGYPCWARAVCGGSGEPETGVAMLAGTRASLMDMIISSTHALIERMEYFISKHAKPSSVASEEKTSAGKLSEPTSSAGGSASTLSAGGSASTSSAGGSASTSSAGSVLTLSAGQGPTKKDQMKARQAEMRTKRNQKKKAQKLVQQAQKNVRKATRKANLPAQPGW